MITRIADVESKRRLMFVAVIVHIFTLTHCSAGEDAGKLIAASVVRYRRAIFMIQLFNLLPSFLDF